MGQPAGIFAERAELRKKLVDRSIAYAVSLGLSPHSDYRKIAPIWGDVTGEQCSELFVFGGGGKPSCFSSPFDDAAKQRMIYASLCETVGEGNFCFTLADRSTVAIDDDQDDPE